MFLQHNPNQKGHGSAYLTSLMTGSKFQKKFNQVCRPFDFILINIQLAQPKLDSLAFYYQAWILLGLHLCWNINPFYSMTLKCFLNSSMPPLDIQTKNARLTSKYNLLVKNHIQLQYMHQSLDS
jgi:hypothetical protein